MHWNLTLIASGLAAAGAVVLFVRFVLNLFRRAWVIAFACLFLSFLALANGPDDQPLDEPGNLAIVEELLTAQAPDIVFMPHGNDTNSGHRVMCSLLRKAAVRTGRPRAALLNRDPKTIRMRADFYLPFGQEEADWKGRLLRFHDSQHQRNLNTRGHGFDERILESDRLAARELGLVLPYAESFELADAFG